MFSSFRVKVDLPAELSPMITVPDWESDPENVEVYGVPEASQLVVVVVPADGM